MIFHTKQNINAVLSCCRKGKELAGDDFGIWENIRVTLRFGNNFAWALREDVFLVMRCFWWWSLYLTVSVTLWVGVVQSCMLEVWVELRAEKQWHDQALYINKEPASGGGKRGRGFCFVAPLSLQLHRCLKWATSPKKKEKKKKKKSQLGITIFDNHP